MNMSTLQNPGTLGRLETNPLELRTLFFLHESSARRATGGGGGQKTAAGCAAGGGGGCQWNAGSATGKGCGGGGVLMQNMTKRMGSRVP